MVYAFFGANRIVIALAVIWAASAHVSQTPATTVVLGRVVEGLSDVPVADALVRFRGLAEPYLRVSALTDAKGYFTFFNVPAGRYELSASKPGYWFGEFGQQRVAGRGRSYVMTSGHRDGEVRVPMWKFAAVSGTVVDEAGEPVVGIGVQAMPASPSGARVYIWNAAPRVYRTDDRGIYRISDLVPGDYLISVPPVEMTSAAPRPVGDAAPGGGLSYAPAFIPGGAKPATDSLLVLASGDERIGVDFRLQLVRSHYVAGRLVGGSSSVNGVLVQMVPSADAFLTDQVVAEALTRADGSFRFDAVVPGEYLVKVFQPSVALKASPFAAAGESRATVRAQRTDTVGWWAATPILVSDSNVDGVSVDLQPTLRISGDVVFNGSAPKPRTQELSLMLMPSPPDGRRLDGLGRTEVDDLFHFRTVELPAGRYFLRWAYGIGAGWALESIMLDGRDALDQPITLRDRDVSEVVVTFTDRISEVTGTVRRATGEIDLNAAVIVFPGDPAMRANYGRESLRVRYARVGLDGRFSVKALPPGDYLAVALNDAEADRWQTSAVLDRVARGATRITVTTGSKESIELKVSPIR